MSLLLTGCGTATPQPEDAGISASGEICGPMIKGPPCSSAKPDVPYRTILYTHCGVRNAYFAGRWWLIDPPQPEGATWITGTVTILNATLADFRSDNGRRYSFMAAPPNYEPPPCY